ncbi:SPRY domain-containing protein 7-like isoform X1 [Limulus polyphemus]|uniref:SPRY domain-containing protein 7 n=1 Tax=Limulus polyphemus TaxID=6850 RepID=A0ABM1BNG4_LIMPO|nr:SPRY domain-containing protein 7-like isoform X1 [Limulus polyphemus]
MAECITSCFRKCLDTPNLGYNSLEETSDIVLLDTKNMGQDVVLVKNGLRICGSGGALANYPLVQNKAYFEVKLQQNGLWGVGLANSEVDLNHVPLGQDSHSWVLTSEGTITHEGEVVDKLPEVLQEGDVLGITYDHVEMNFFINGKPLHTPITGIKGEVYPVLYVDDGAILDATFSKFYHQPPQGFDKIMVEKSLL